MSNFSEAASRHWTDGKLLFEAERYDNADQLFGFTAECAIKAALNSIAGQRREAELGDRYWCHIETLWDRAPIQQLSKNYPGLVTLLRQQNPFSNWAASQRYDAAGTISREVSDDHRKVAQRLLRATQLIGTRAGAT